MYIHTSISTYLHRSKTFKDTLKKKDEDLPTGRKKVGKIPHEAKKLTVNVNLLHCFFNFSENGFNDFSINFLWSLHTRRIITYI